jgi:hypothetical protein
LVSKLYVKFYRITDHEETFAPIDEWDTIWTTLALETHHKWVLVLQINVKLTFLKIYIEEEVYAQQPFILKYKENPFFSVNWRRNCMGWKKILQLGIQEF